MRKPYLRFSCASDSKRFCIFEFLNFTFTDVIPSGDILEAGIRKFFEYIR